MKSPFTLSLRYAVFDADSYDSRIYCYESDVAEAYSIPAFYDKGIRYYIMLRYHIMHGIDFWIRFAQTQYSNKNTLGSGLTQIDGSVKSEIKLQLRYKF
mgnify:CR=1 FL=1